MKRVGLLLILALGFTASAASFKPEEVRFEQKIGLKIPSQLHVLDELGRDSKLGELLGQAPTVLVFSYYRCPNLCTLVLNGLTTALLKMDLSLGKDYQILSLSIDPTEKPSLGLAKKRSYLARMGLTERATGWHFLTATEPVIESLTEAAGFHNKKDPDSGEYAHPSGFLILTPDGRISKYFFGIQFDPAGLKKAIQQAAKGRDGSWVSEVLIYCFHYDPNLSSRGPWVLRWVRRSAAAGALGVVALLVFLFAGKGKESTS